MTWLYGLHDPADRWVGQDKIEHLMGGFAAYLIAVRVTSGVWPFVWVLVAGVAVELIELVRYRRWVAKDRPQPWPWLTDKVSVKDLIADVLGAALAAAVMAVT